MKYPQLVSMPSTVQDWLDEQLEARGIDAVVYTRYIFSLLQRDTLDLPDDLLTLSSSKSKKFGIEKLVDELCAKLKEIQSEGENITHSNSSQSSVSVPQTHSPSDQAQKYYAAFPPLNRCDDSSSKALIVSPDQSSAWGSKKVLATSFGKNKQQTSTLGTDSKIAEITNSVENKENQQKNVGNLSNETAKANMRSRNQVKDKDASYTKGKELGYGFAWNVTEEWNNECSQTSAVPNVDTLITGWRVSKYNRQNREELDKPVASEEPLSIEQEIWHIGASRLYEPQMENEQKLSVANENGTMQNCVNESGQCLDENLAQLIAKFDHSIEALWSLESKSENVSPESKKSPISPLENQILVEQGISGSKYLPIQNPNNSFIHCGTNITNSIWSSQPPHSISLDTYEKKVQSQEQANVSYHVSDDLENGTIRCIIEGRRNVDKPDVLGSNEKVVGNMSANSGHQLNTKCILGKGIPVKNFENNMLPISRKTMWSKFESFPALPPAFPTERQDCVYPERTKNSCNKKRLVYETSNILTGRFPHYSMFTNCQIKSESCNNFSDCSFGTLNHNKEDSSFIEVVPKQSVCNFLFESNRLISPLASTTHTHSDDMYLMGNETKKNGEVAEIVKDKEEEDLLTSTRTHFRPIRQESSDSHNNNTGGYADGTTFVIPNSLESVPFKRSESGALYLETDLGIETPKKYMEYKDKEPNSGRHKTVKTPDFVTSLGKDFVPKFRVHQIEKYCQTEESDENVTSDEEIDSKRSRQELKNCDSEFYFPGDEHFAEKIVNCLESDDDHIDQTVNNRQSLSVLVTNKNANEGKLSLLTKHNEQHQTFKMPEDTSVSSEEISYRWSAAVKNCCKCNRNSFAACKTGWLKETHGLSASQAGIWGPETSVLPRSWYDIWRGIDEKDMNMCKNCGDEGEASSHDLSPQHLKLREELSQDGEQLLSDLSYMQNLYQGSDSNDSGPGFNEKMQCLSPPAEASNDVQLYDDSDFGVNSAAHSHHSSNHEGLNGKENKSFEDFVSTCSPRMLPIKILLSKEVDAEKKINERPFSLKMSAKDRKRRHSGCLRHLGSNQPYEACSTGYHAAQEFSAALGFRLWAIADTTRLKGSCGLRSLRPVTL